MKTSKEEVSGIAVFMITVGFCIWLSDVLFLDSLFVQIIFVGLGGGLGGFINARLGFTPNKIFLFKKK